MRLNNKGFTIIEVFAAITILSLLIIITVPSVNRLIDKNNQKNYEILEDGIINATKILLSDYRYDILINGNCNNEAEIKNIKSINEYILTNSKVTIDILIKENNINTEHDGNIYNPFNKSQILDLEKSYVTVKYQCQNKEFTYELGELIWKKKD